MDIVREFGAVQNAFDDRGNTPWFMQGMVLCPPKAWFCARPHRTAEVFYFLNEYFDDRVISQDYCKHTGSDKNWPPYSPEMTHCEFCLSLCVGEYLKDEA